MGFGLFQMQCRACNSVWNDYWCSIQGGWRMNDWKECPHCGSKDIFNNGVDPMVKEV